MKQIIYAAMLLLCMSIIGCQKESTTKPSSYPLVKKITVNSIHNSWFVSFEYDSKGRITNLNFGGDNSTIDYEHYSNGEGQIIATSGHASINIFMKDGLCYECKYPDPSLGTEKFEYNGNHLILWDDHTSFTWAQDLLIRRDSDSYHNASFEYGDVNPFAEQQINMTEFLIYGLSGNTPNLLGFCGMEPRKLITNEIETSTIGAHETTYDYKYENGLITEVKVNPENVTCYIEYY